MSSRRLAILAAGALTVVGAGVAIATTEGDNGKEVEDAILNDAAERLDVGADELRSALSEAQLAQIDKAVEEGRLTEEQAEMIKEHMTESGRVLGFPGGPGGPGGPPPFGGPLGPGPGGPEVFEAIADELGISAERLHRQLLNGKSMRQIAEANGKSMADVKEAAREAIENELDQAVEDGNLTEEQADQIREDLPAILDRLARGPRGPSFHEEREFHGGPGFFDGPGGPPGGPDFGPPPS